MEDEMIKLEEELARFKPIDLKTLEKKLGGIPDEARSALSMYNKALDDIGNGNEDIAVIALKKAIALYPGFYEAMNLMGLCHIRLGEEDKARALFLQVVQLDDSSLRAKDYLDRLDGVLPDSTPQHGKRSRGRSTRTLPAWMAKGLAPESNGPWVLKYLAGFLLGALVLGGLWQLTGENPLVSIDRSKPDLEARLAALQQENSDYQDALAEKTRDLESANLIQQDLVEEMEAYRQWTARLTTLRTLAAESQYTEIIRIIDQDYQGLDIPPDIQTQLAALRDQARPEALRMLFDAAMALYKGNAKAQDKTVYQQAMTAFDQAIDLMEELEEAPAYAGELYFYAAKAYWLSALPNQEEANRLAVASFEKVIEFEPKTARGKSAVVWIGEIEAGRAVKP
jgi:tetratricopeptide (TPR) repeat protein